VAAADPAVQRNCQHVWVTITTTSGAGGFVFRHCSRCGMNSWLGPQGPVTLDEVLKELSLTRVRGGARGNASAA
jgi:hypothetical protein